MYGDLSHIKAAVEALPPLLEARANQIRWQRCEDSLRELRQRLSTCGSGESQAAVILRLRSAVDAKDPAAYQEAFDRLVDLHRRAVDLERRRTLLARLEQAAPAWADAIRSRRERHAAASVPGVAASAWLWRQLNDELERRGRTSLDELQRKITKLEEQLMRVTADLIERRAWHWQLGRIDTKKQQALVGWLDTIRKIGRGSGKRVPRLRAVARQRMSECRTAVPVWIMPLVRVVENFDPRSTRFDVLIIDEASQCDVMGLIALYMARAVVVVGDHEQVSPDAVGQDVLAVQNLIDVHLYDIPNAQLYDGKTSVYDLARESFPSTIRLLEHFRCVPEIIQFSNWLCYDGQIRPLRDASLVKLKPHVVAYKVEGALAKDKVNEQEAWAAASLLVAATEQPEYAGKTFGAISLVGEDQAITINRLLLRHLNPEEFSRRRIVCGNAAQFQGDERDVMFLSIVDTSDEGPLRRRDDDRFRQRFNVAASRACDQMWIVYSLDPRVDLKPGDLRRVLIEHAEDPGALLRSLADAGQRVESEFEKDVLRHLSRRGYRAVPQWKVGHYRIDLVVEGLSGRLAVECDGERAHPLEKLEEDMSRQAVLERLGWIFVRIRGSQFYRDAEAAMRPVYEKLDRLEIEPLGPELEPQESAGAVHDALIDRVVRRADELRREWRRPGAIEDYQAGLGVSSKAGQVSTSYGSRVKQPPRSIATESLEQPAAAESELRALTVAATSEARTAPIVRRTPRSTEDAVSVTRAGLQSTPRLFPSEQPVESEPVKDVTHGRRGRRSEIQPTPEDERTIAWIMSTEPGAWFSLAQWGKANEKLLPWERGLAFSIGRLVSRQMVPTVRQVRQAKRIYDETIDAGFTPEPRQG
jgi:very-short-patch-repair endonuclease